MANRELVDAFIKSIASENNSGRVRVKDLVPIRAGHEITMSYGDDACDCDREANQLQIQRA